MKAVFATLLAVMAGWTAVAVLTLPDRRSDVPILHWTTDANQARDGQIRRFEAWMVENGYPPVDLELDSNNTGQMKVIIQSASGVGSPIIDVYTGLQLRQYVASGVLLDLTDLANDPAYGFGLSRTYPAVREEICVDGRQYTFPCNVTGWPLVINRGLLEREHLPLPKYDWTWEEFLTWCQAVRKVDARGRVTRFAIMPFGAEYLWAGNGASIFNETMTRCVLDRPEAIEATQFYFDLMFRHRVMPTPVDEAAATEGGWGPRVKWLGNEQAVAHQVGRWCLVTLRKDYEGFKADVALLPHKVMPMQPVTSRSAGINAASADPALVARFQQYLASAAYNDLIVHDADALPPNPGLIDPDRRPLNTAFFRPPEYPDEWGPDYSIHDKFRRAVTDHGVGREYSPFLLPPVVDREVRKWQEGIANGQVTVEKGMRELTARINLELGRAVQRDPALQGRYHEALELQGKIDALQAAGKAVPLEWIANPVIRRLREAGK